MSQGFNDLSDEDKLTLALEYRAHGTALPDELRKFLVSAGLYELVFTKDEHEG